jgi:hypothetical protein
MASRTAPGERLVGGALRTGEYLDVGTSFCNGKSESLAVGQFGASQYIRLQNVLNGEAIAVPDDPKNDHRRPLRCLASVWDFRLHPRMAAAKSSSLVDTRVVYCGDNLDQLRKLPAACVDLIYIDLACSTLIAIFPAVVVVCSAMR